MLDEHLLRVVTHVFVNAGEFQPLCWHLPADVAADDDVAAHDGSSPVIVRDRVRHHRGSHRELHRCGVDNAHNISRPRGFQEAEEGPVRTILSVQLDHLLVVVWALEKLNAGVERAAVSLEEYLHAVNRWVERVRAEGTTLDGHGG